MTDDRGHCTLVVTGAPLAARTADIIAALRADHWVVRTVASAAATATWHVSSSGSREHQPDVVLALPLTFNTLAKTSLGIADTPAAGVLCEALGSRTPLVITLMAKQEMWQHPRFADHLETLRTAGANFLDPATGGHRLAPLQSGTGEQVASLFNPQWAISAVRTAVIHSNSPTPKHYGTRAVSPTQ